MLKLSPSILVAVLLAFVGCGSSDDTSGRATLKIVNGESGCTLSQVYITPAGEAQGENLVANDGIGYNDAPRAFRVEPGTVYSLSVWSNTTTSNLDPEANCSIHFTAGQTRIVTYSYSGGPSTYWGNLSGCD